MNVVSETKLLLNEDVPPPETDMWETSVVVVTKGGV